MRTRIFATPSEPHFNLESFSLSPNLLEESLNILAEENEKLIDSAEKTFCCFKDGNPVEFILRLCQQMKMLPIIKYTAMELFDKFMERHIRELYDTVRSSSSKDRQNDWLNVEQRLQEQIPLRAVSCIQVASKLATHYKALNPTKSKRLLASLGYHYTIAGVIKSEVRLLKTLEFCVAVSTPLTFIETLLEVIGLNDSNIKVKMIHDVSLKLLDAFYLRRTHILEELCRSATEEVQCRDITLLGADYLLLATAIILAASQVLNNEMSHKIANQLFIITQMPQTDIKEFSRIILQEVLGKLP